jgi:hypothetical protein
VITHIVSFRWKPDITQADIDAISAALATMPDLVPTIGSYRFGSDLGVNGPGNMDFAIVATFDSVEDWKAYDEHPEHDAVRAAVIRPWIAERAAVQFRS